MAKGYTVKTIRCATGSDIIDLRTNDGLYIAIYQIAGGLTEVSVHKCFAKSVEMNAHDEFKNEAVSLRFRM